ncbi:MAG: tetratricopeptide repeat protein [Anaerovoracaceae bacterium]|jgi:tetratricopeptide (TPR) repeat protein
MIINPNVTELKRKLEKIYKSIETRRNEKLWHDAVSQAYQDDSEAAMTAVIDFVQLHKYIPSDIVKTVIRDADIQNHPAHLAEVYGIDVLHNIYLRSIKRDAVNYAKLPEDMTDEDLGELISLIEDAEKRISRGQVYLAACAVEAVARKFPDSEAAARLKKEYLEMRPDGGLRKEFPADKSAKESLSEKNGAGERLIENNRLDEATAYFENLISEDYENYKAYFALCSLYIQNGSIEKADYIADLMLELGIYESEIRVLKGTILEQREQYEDALYYYETACRADRSSKNALTARAKLLAKLDGPDRISEDKDHNIDMLCAAGSKPENKYDLSTMKIPPYILEIIDETDGYSAKGRMTEAYYELSKSSETYKESSLLVFKKAYALYLMKREAEARQILKTIGRDDIMYQRAGYLIEDIDHNIIDQKKFDDISDISMAEILFESGHYAESLAKINSVDISSMDAASWALKGRCEVETGQLQTATESFANAIDADYHVEGVREILAMIYQVRGENDKALDMYDSAAKLAEDPAPLCAMKARMLYKLGYVKELSDYRKSAFALIGHPSDADAYDSLMKIKNGESSDELFIPLEYAVLTGSSETEFYVECIKEYINKGSLHRAVLCAESGTSAAGEPEKLYYYKALALYRSGKLDSAEIIADVMMADNPDNAAVRFLMGLIAKDRGDMKKSLRWFLSACDYDPDNHRYVSAAADSFYNSGDFDNAIKYYTKAVTLDREDYSSFKKRAEIFAKRGEDQRALDDINCALLLKPDDAELYILIGKIISGYEIEETTEVVHGTDSADTVSESEASGKDDGKKSGKDDGKKIGKGDGKKSGKGKRKEKEEEGEGEEGGEGSAETDYINDVEKGPEYYYSRAVEIDPENVEAYVCRAKYRSEQGRLGDAMKDVDKALELDPDNEELFLLRGIIWLLSGKYEEADKDFRKSAELDPENLSAYSYISKCNNALNKYEEALEAAEIGLKIDSDFVNLYVNRGVAYYNLARYDDAVEDFNTVIMHKNEVSTSAMETAYKYKGMSYEKLGNRSEAASCYRILLKYNPEASNIREKITMLESEMKDEKPRSIFSFLHKNKKKN